MTCDEYMREDTRLREVLQDALNRGDYYLEMDVAEMLVSLRDRWYASDDGSDDGDTETGSTQD